MAVMLQLFVRALRVPHIYSNEADRLLMRSGHDGRNRQRRIQYLNDHFGAFLTQPLCEPWLQSLILESTSYSFAIREHKTPDD